MKKEKEKNKTEETRSVEAELDFLEQCDVDADLDEADLEMNERYQAF